MDEGYLKAFVGVLTASLGWVWAWGRGNNKKHERHNDRICELQRKSAVSEEQIKHMLTKLDEVLELGSDLKKMNQTILRALARKTKHDK